jgi:superfamily II DNA or RNA helicase
MSDGKLDIFCASQNIFSEGISQNNLSCLILGSPIGNNESLLEQLVGRVQREDEDKLVPIVVDIGLGGYTGRNHQKARMAIYAQNGWKVEKMTLGKLINKDRNAFAKLLEFKV